MLPHFLGRAAARPSAPVQEFGQGKEVDHPGRSKPGFESCRQS